MRAAGYRDSTPWLDAVTINCRVVAVVSRWGLGIGWDGNTDDNLRAYTVDSARKLGVNLMAYATAQRAWARQFAHSLQLVDREPSWAGKISIAQVVYDGEWKTRHKGLSVLLQQFHQNTGVPVKFAVCELRLSDATLFDSPLLYMTGHEDFQLSPAEVQGLWEYLRRGGFLFAEACCGRLAFDRAVRRELRRVLPEHALQPVATGETLLTLPNRIETVGLTPALAQRLNRSRAEPRLESITIEGHLAVVYSPWGLTGGVGALAQPLRAGAGRILLPRRRHQRADGRAHSVVRRRPSSTNRLRDREDRQVDRHHEHEHDAAEEADHNRLE